MRAGGGRDDQRRRQRQRRSRCEPNGHDLELPETRDRQCLNACRPQIEAALGQILFPSRRQGEKANRFPRRRLQTRLPAAPSSRPAPGARFRRHAARRPFVEHRARRAPARQAGRRRDDEHLVGLRRPGRAQAGQGGEPVRTAAAPRHWRGRRVRATGRLRDRPASARRAAGPSTTCARRACAGRGKPRRAPCRRRSPPRRRARRSWWRRTTARRSPAASVMSAGRAARARPAHWRSARRPYAPRAPPHGRCRRARRSRRGVYSVPASVTCVSVSAAGCGDLTRPRGKRRKRFAQSVGRDLAVLGRARRQAWRRR